LVVEGEDAGRWKVKLGGGNANAGGSNYQCCDTVDEVEKEEEGSNRAVVAKAENLELLPSAEGCDDGDEDAGGGNDDEDTGMLFDNTALVGSRSKSRSQSRSQSRSASASSQQQQRRGGGDSIVHEGDYDIHRTVSRDPEEEDYNIHPSSSVDPEEELDAFPSPHRHYHHGHHHHGRQAHHPSHIRPARDPSTSSSRTKNNPVVVTPDRSNDNTNSAGGNLGITPISYYKSENGEYHESPSRTSRLQQTSRSSQQHQKKQLAKNNAMQPTTTSRRDPSINGRKNSPPRTNNINTSKKQHGTTAASTTHKPSPSKPSSNGIKNKMRRSPSNESARLSSAFSRMLLSPVSFTPVSFHPDRGESSFRKWGGHGGGGDDGLDGNRPTPNEGRHHGDDHLQQQRGRQGRQRGRSFGSQGPPTPQQQYLPNKYNSSPGDVVSIAGSFFDEVTPTSFEKNLYPYNEGDEDNHGVTGGNNHDIWARSNDHDETTSGPQLEPYPSQEYSTVDVSARGGGVGLPTIVVLPVDEDDFDNPFLSPGYSSTSPPHCVGVQNAGVSHVNGVYLLALPKRNEGAADDDDDSPAPPPLYFRDGPPILLSDNRYYDMCILRIDCPDSTDHVIWFLARVDVDPECLDVKFSDCYYYCRMLRNDDGCGGEVSGGGTSELLGEPCRSPPMRGWNVPKLPPGVEMLRIAPEPGDGNNGDAEFRDDGGGIIVDSNDNGMDSSYDDPESDFLSPGVTMGTSKMSMSKYSI